MPQKSLDKNLISPPSDGKKLGIESRQAITARPLTRIVSLDFRFLFAYYRLVTKARETEAAMKPLLSNGEQNIIYESLRRNYDKPSEQNLFKNGTATSPLNATQMPPSKPLRRTATWVFPEQGLAVFYGLGNVPRLSHYFLPRLLLQGKRVLFLDGANSADPRLLARLARARQVPFEMFNRQIEIARAFTCFQLTELISRVPLFIRSFPADVLVVTALPDLYFDEDVRDWDARVAFEQALRDLSRLARQPLSIAIFSAATTFTPSAARKNFFAKVCCATGEVWRFSLDESGKPNLICERAPAAARLKPAAALAK